MSEHPAGWYPDPRGRHEYRYWDGSVWTDHVADAGVAAHDPVGNAEPATTRPDGGATGHGDGPAGRETATHDPAPRHEAAERREAGPDRAAAERHDAGPDHETAPGHKAAPGHEAAPGGDAAAAGDDEAGLADEARAALRSATATKSPALAGLLTVVFPGSGHFYLGAGDKAPLAAGLLAATAVAYLLAWFSFPLFVIGFAVWVAAAAFGVLDLQAVLKPIRAAGAAAASISPQQVGLVLVGGGVALVLGLALPWYHLSEITIRVGTGQAQTYGPSTLAGVHASGSGFAALAVADLVLVAIAVASVLLGAAALGLGPLDTRRLPGWLPSAVAGVGLVGLVIVAFRLAFAVPGVFTAAAPPQLGIEVVDADLGRGPGILLAGAATLAIAAAGIVTLIQAPRTARPAASADGA